MKIVIDIPEERYKDIQRIASENGEANYCPNCGAKMVEPQESEE